MIGYRRWLQIYAWVLNRWPEPALLEFVRGRLDAAWYALGDEGKERAPRVPFRTVTQ
jgi:hypothetical protein